MNCYHHTAGKFVVAACLCVIVFQTFGQETTTFEASPATSAVATPDASSTEKRTALLQTPISIKFENVWLPRAILQIFESHHIPLTQKARALLATTEKTFANADSIRVQEIVDLRITGEYQNIPLRSVLNDLCRIWSHRWTTYWIISDGMIDVGWLDLENEEHLISLMTPQIRVFDVTAVVSIKDAWETTDNRHPLIRTVLDAGQTNRLAQMLSGQVAEIKRQGGTEADVAALEPAAKLLKHGSKTLLIVRHNVLSQNAIQTLLDELQAVTGSK